jgi:hypothetical protein
VTLGLLAFTILAFCLLLNEQDKRAHEDRVLRDKRNDEERAAHRLEVLGLLQRIQAPELAVIAHQEAGLSPEGSPPLSDAEMAQQQEATELIRDMERIENEALLR